VENVGDVFKEDKAENDVLVFGRIDVLAEFVGGFPQLLFQRVGLEVGFAGVAGVHTGILL
ncbi:MAG: hypothetical protein FWD88_08015, partial [Treponema sp.]|nr:hypothetical protein [Treponema sp.]